MENERQKQRQKSCRVKTGMTERRATDSKEDLLYNEQLQAQDFFHGGGGAKTSVIRSKRENSCFNPSLSRSVHVKHT